MNFVDQILSQLSELIQLQRFVDLETETLEIKSVPSSGSEWKELLISANAFLNTRGGIIILGVKEEGQGTGRRYVLTGWKEHAEPNVKELRKIFTDQNGAAQDLTDRFSQMEIKNLLDQRVAVLYVDELAADRKFVFFKGVAYKRVLTGDHRLSDAEITAQEEFKLEAIHARELQPVPNLTEADLDLDTLNKYIYQLNQPVLVETLKADMAQAHAFLERRYFVKDGAVTILGALVCAKHPGTFLGFRSQVHGYVDVPSQSMDNKELQVVQDKQDFDDNVIQLMESSLGYLLRNIQVGISTLEGGTRQPQYPSTLLRETVNNALAHRDYSINRQVIITIKPGEHIAIQNPGKFRSQLLIEAASDPIPLHRILPEAKPRNPKLADVLRVYRKWEGRGIGMATLVNLSLQNQIDLPLYRLLTEEVRLQISAGRLLDDRMEKLFESFDGYIEERLNGNSLSEEQKLVLSYLIKSERANEKQWYTILLTADNNHFDALRGLEKSGLIQKHPKGMPNYPIYIADRVLMNSGYVPELRQIFGLAFDGMDPLLKHILAVVYRFNKFSKTVSVSAKQASYAMWYEGERASNAIEQFDAFYRKIRYAFNKLEAGELIYKKPGVRGYLLNNDYLKTHLL